MDLLGRFGRVFMYNAVNGAGKVAEVGNEVFKYFKLYFVCLFIIICKSYSLVVLNLFRLLGVLQESPWMS